MLRLIARGGLLCVRGSGRRRQHHRSLRFLDTHERQTGDSWCTLYVGNAPSHRANVRLASLNVCSFVFAEPEEVANAIEEHGRRWVFCNEPMSLRRELSTPPQLDVTPRLS
jgi:hypothetical protein|tara:strand:- start:167 stop:499 length:333 start_codon:yes stop_codon:yes gene_type:complete